MSPSSAPVGSRAITRRVMAPMTGRSYGRGMPTAAVGDLLRDWRHRRHRSQMDLALDAGVSPRHLSFVETGRSRPSPEVVLALARHLEVPLREQNTLLLAAGYAPRFHETSLDDDAMARVRASLQRMLDAHDPYPGVVIDRQWNVALANAAELQLTAGVPDHLLGPELNVFRSSLHRRAWPPAPTTSRTGPPTCSARSVGRCASPATSGGLRSNRRCAPTRTWPRSPTTPSWSCGAPRPPAGPAPAGAEPVLVRCGRGGAARWRCGRRSTPGGRRR